MEMKTATLYSHSRAFLDTNLVRRSSTLRTCGSRTLLQSKFVTPHQQSIGISGQAHRNQVRPLYVRSVATTSTEVVGGSGLDPITAFIKPDELFSINKMLVELRNEGGPSDGRITFPPTLSARQRLRAHEIAERLGLGHLSLGQGNQRCFTAWRLPVIERLAKLRQLLDAEEAASRVNFMTDQPLQSWRVLEAQGILLHSASVIEREAASFGRERWVLEDGLGVERSGHVARFSHRARPGMAICLAGKDSTGNWVVAKGQPPGRVAWSRGKKICLIFDHPPASSEQNNVADVLLVSDSSSFERMHAVIRDCEQGDPGMNKLLDGLLGSGIKLSSTFSMRVQGNRDDDSTPSTRNIEKEQEIEGLFDKGLNIEQRAAVKLCTEPGASPVVLIHGPFGTGKTRTLVEVVQQKVKAGSRVLVCAASNAAVDNMVHALITADSALPLARAGLTERVATSVAAFTMEALQDAQPEAAIARRLRKEAYAMQLTAEKWTRATTGVEKRRNARKEVNALFKDARRLDRMCAASVLQRTKVLCGTLTGFASALRELGNADETRFDCAIVDEASQAITPALLLVLPFLKVSDSSEVAKTTTRAPLLVLAGDHQQLPPTVLFEDADGKDGGLEVTLFEELMERDGGGLGTRIRDLVSNVERWEAAKLSILSQAHALASTTEGSMHQSNSLKSFAAGQISLALCQQYRMPSQLMAFPSAAFYGAELISRQCALLNTGSTLENNDATSILQAGLLLEVIDTAGAGCEEERIGEGFPSSGRSSPAIELFSTSNPGQANLTTRVVRELLLSAKYSATQIGVVTPYSAQVMLLRKLMAEEVEAGLEIDSVDAYQGREKEIIVMDAVRSNTEGSIGFLSDFHRLNVGITRARQKLIVIGDSATLSIDPVWAVFFHWISEYREKPSTGIRYQSFFELPMEGGW